MFQLDSVHLWKYKKVISEESFDSPALNLRQASAGLETRRAQRELSILQRFQTSGQRKTYSGK